MPFDDSELHSARPAYHPCIIAPGRRGASELETRPLNTRWAETGYASALPAFVVSVLFFVDVLGEYFVNTSYLFSIAL